MTETTLRRTKSGVYGVEAAAPPPVAAFLAITRGLQTYASTYSIDGTFIRDLGTPVSDDPTGFALAVAGFGGELDEDTLGSPIARVAWRSSDTTIRIWDVIAETVNTFTAPANKTYGAPIYAAEANRIQVARCTKVSSGTQFVQFQEVNPLGGTDPNTISGPFMTSFAVAGSLTWEIRGAVLYYNPWPEQNALVYLRTNTGRTWAIRMSVSHGNLYSGAQLNSEITAAGDPDLMLLGASNSQAATVGVVKLSSGYNDASPTLQSVNWQSGATVPAPVAGWPTTGDWELDGVLNISYRAALGSDLDIGYPGDSVMLYGTLGGVRKGIVAAATATSGDPSAVVTPEDHPTAGTQPHLMFLLRKSA